MPRLNEKRARQLRQTLNLVPFLANHPGVPVQTVCSMFGMSTKALMRAVGEILMLGLPPYGPMDYVTAWVEDGRVTVVNAEFLRKPLGLTVAEAVSLRLVVEDFIRQSPGVFDEAAAALAAKVSALLGKVARENGPRPPVPEKMRAIERALEEGRRLRITYYSRAEDRMSERTVEPLALVDIEGLWYLVAFCLLRNAERSFRTDRVRQAVVLDERSDRSRHFDIARYQRREMFFPSGREMRVKIRFGPDSSRWATERFRGRVVKHCSDGSLLCEFRTSDMTWIADLLVDFAGDARIVGPPQARMEVRKRLNAIARKYSNRGRRTVAGGPDSP